MARRLRGCRQNQRRQQMEDYGQRKSRNAGSTPDESFRLPGFFRRANVNAGVEAGRQEFLL